MTVMPPWSRCKLSAPEVKTFADEPLEIVLLEKNTTAAPAPDGEDAAGDEDLTALEREGVIVAEKIRQLMAKKPQAPYILDKDTGQYRPLCYRDIVILMRSTQSGGQLRKSCAAVSDIPLSTGYFASTEIQIMLSLLQVLDNPRQDIPLAAVLRAPFGFNENRLKSPHRRRDADLWRALQKTAKREKRIICGCRRIFCPDRTLAGHCQEGKTNHIDCHCLQGNGICRLCGGNA